MPTNHLIFLDTLIEEASTELGEAIAENDIRAQVRALELTGRLSALLRVRLDADTYAD